MRKKFLLMIFVLSLFTSMGGGWLHAQTKNGVLSTNAETITLFEDDFNDGDLDGWRLIDGDNDGNNWYLDTDNGYVVVLSFDEEGNKALDPKDYIVTTNSFLIDESSVLTLKVRPKSAKPNFIYDKYSVVVSEDNTNWKEIGGESFEQPSELTLKSFNLSGYAGKTVYIGILCNSDDYWANYAGVIIDDVKLTGAAPAAEPVAKIGETPYTSFADALNAIGSGDVVINLLKDVTMDITAWQTLAIGAKNTTSITIDGENGDNDFTLTFNKLNSDWNHIATSNDNATKLILKNLKLADSGKNNGPWNRYDHNFACDVELTNVVSNKALAFKAGATLNNVTINETGDNYAIWIQPNGQDVDINGLTVVSAGRGIKIDNQYVGDAQLVNLSVKNAQFETVKKAAIVVKSPAGANIVAENVDITKVAADSKNLVWVDEDGATDFGMVTLTGGTVAQEGIEGFVAAITKGANDKVQAYYTSLQAAIDAVQNGETIVLTKDCAEKVSINKSNVAFTINGKISDTENIAYTGKIQINVGQNVTVKNINFSHADDEAHDFIANVGSPTGKNYNTTLLVEGCSFVGGNNNYNTVAVRTIHPTHTQIKNSTGTGLHSFLQNTGGQQVTVEGVVLTDSKGGLAISSPNGAVSVKGCDLTTNTYGVRLDANNTNAPGATLENNKVNAYIPVSVRKATAPNYNLTFNGEENAYVATNDDNVWCAVCTTEYEEGVALNAPTGKVRVTLNGAGLNADGIYGNSINFEGLGTEESPYLINNLNDLKFFRNNVNAGNKYSGKYVKLTADIDLNNENWTPIGTSSNPFNGTFDGQNHTISNLVINGGSNSDQGFFGRTNDGEIKNVTFNKAKVTGRLNVGVVAGTPYTSKYTNVKVTGHVEVNGMAYVGGVGGKNAYANWTDITVDVDATSYVKANSVENGTAYRTYVGGVVGFNGEGGHTFKNISSNIKVIGSTMDIGGIFGIAHYSNKFEYITFTGSVEAPEGAKEVGGIAGVWHNEKGTSVTFTNCTSTGTVKVGDVTTTGSIVGAAYNPDNKYEENSGSLIIDGEEAWLPRKVATKAELDAALAAAKEGNTITLTADIDYGTAQLAITKAITLDLGGKTLTTQNAYGGMSVKDNPTIKNGTIVHKSNTAAIKVWNATAFENLVIDVQGKGDANKTIGGIVLQSGSTTRVGSIKNVTIKGAALTNGIETYNCGEATENVIGSMENVTIDAQGTGMLIYAPCGTATNCSISGGTNGIEIWIKGNYSASLDLVASKVEGGVYAHDEFINNPDIVNKGTLSLTADDATTGAGVEDVTLTIARAKAENVKGVLKDVMEAAQAKIGDTYYTTIEKAFKAAQAGQTVTILKAGTYALKVKNNVTITGAVNGVEFANIGAFGCNGANVTFNNVTFTYAESSTYKGLQHSGNLVYNNCTFNGQVFLYGASETFNNCTFNTTDSNNYNVWTYGAKEVAFNECTFNCAGKSVLIYNESASVNNNVAVTNSQFNASQAVEGKAAIEMDSSLQGTINLTIDGETTATGFAAGNVSGNSLWNNKKDNNDITVVVNNETVLAPINGDGTEDNPYLINNVRELVAFRKSVNAGKTEFNAPGVYVALNADIDLAGTTWERGIGDGINATFDGIFDGRDKTIKNLTMNPTPDSDGYVCGGLFGYINGAATIKNLVIENATITATVNGGGQGHNVGVLVGFANNNGGKATIDNVTVKGDVKVDAPNVYGVGTIVGYSYRDMGTISNCTVDANEGSYIKGYSFVGGITGYSYSNAVISNCSVENLAITATSKGVGGIAGLALEGNNISGCTVANTTTVNGETNVAYIIGELGNSNGNVIIENCTAPQPWVGGAYATGEPFVATIGTKYYTSIKDAIKAVKDNETIVLIRDITMDYNARDSYETQTQNIVIDGNDHTLTLNQKNSDWASIGLANNSKLVLNNMTIEKTGYGDTSGAWNTHAIIFSCPLEMTKVTVNNGIAVQAGATLNNVTINEANGYYGLWINGNGQSVTMNGGSITATNGGRGIKIADQYIDAPAQVTLNVTGTVFNTAKKAAVLVSSKAGAEITASNVNIENVAEDTVNFVWVDEDWAANFGNVEVTGAKVAQEGIEKFVAEVKKDAKVEGYYASLQAAVNAVQNGESVTLTLINDVAENVTVSQAPNVAITIDGNNKTFKGTITVDGKSAAYATAGLTIKNVNFDATNISKDACINLGGNNSIRYTSNVTVEYCTFTGTDKAKVGVKNYTGGCKNVTIKNCTATGLHSLAQLKTSTTVTLAENTVTESKNGVSLGSSTGVTVTECTFTVDGYGIRPDGGASVTITDSNISAFIPVVVRNASADASLTFNGTNDMTETNTDGYWCVIGTSEYEENGELPTAATGNVIVNLNDEGLSYEGVYGNYAVAKIDKVQYASLQAAIEDAQNGETVILFANTDEVVSVNVLNKKISIVGEEALFPVLKGGLDFGIDNHSQDAGNITIKGIKFVGNGIKIDDMASVTIEGNIFEDITASNAIYVAADEYTTTLAITNNIITKVAGAGINLRNPINATITGNAITNVTGNAMTFQNDGAIEDVAGEIVITGNVLTDWANGKTEGRAIRLALGNIADNVIIEENAMIAANAPEEFVKISGTSNAEISVDENYWNGVAPTAQHFLADGVQIHNYYASYNVETNTLSNLVTLAGEILEKFYTAAGVETTKEQAAYSLSFAITDYDNKEASVKIGSKAPSSGVKLVTPTEVQINGETYSVTSLAKNAFSGTNFASIEISEGVTIIGDYALANMYKLTDVIFPSTLKTVGYRCFYGYGPTANSLETITSYATEVPAAEAASFQTAVGENATLYVYGNYNDYKKAEGWKKFTNIIGKVIVEKEGYSLLVKVSDNNCSVQINDRPAQAAKLQLEIPAEIDYFGTTREITSIANNGFKSCSFYGTITVPGTVKTVGNSAFNTCTQVSKVVFEEGVETIGTRALATMGNLTTVVFPSTLKTLADECFYGYHAENHKVTTIVSYATEAPTAVAGTFQQGICNKATLYVFEDAIASYKAAAGWKKFVNVKAIEAQIGETYYLTLASAIKAAQASDVIELIANVEAADATPIVIPTDVTLNINTHNIKANIYGTVKTEGGVWTTVAVPGFASRAMLGDDAIYSTTDATVANLENEIEVVAGTIVLNPNPEKEWWTLPGQSLSIAEDATFKVPANVKFTVRENTHVVADGTIVTEGVVYLQAGATVEAAEGLNIQTEVEDHVVEYTDGIYSVVRAIFTQTIQLNAGWNWFSSYVETDLESLQNALGENGVMIKNHHHGYTENEDGEWWGTLDTFDSEQMYLIKINEDQQLIIEGEMINPSEHPISINQGWNAIAYMLNTSMSLKDALASINPIEGDYIKGRTGYAEFDGEEWFGNLSTMIPGEGYMFKNSSDEVRTLTYSYPTYSYPTRGTNTEAKANVTTDGNHWIPSSSQFANNMTMTAMLDHDGANYEVAAFVNGECRGSARPIYVEALDAYMLFLTIHGEEVEEMTFKYYDIDTDIEYTLSDRINYSNNAILGSLKEPYMFTRGTTDIGEAELSQLNIYPNPTTTAAEINLNATFDMVEVFNALGVKVAEYSNVDSIDALETAGIYVIRATNNSVISHCRLVVK